MWMSCAILHLHAKECSQLFHSCFRQEADGLWTAHLLGVLCHRLCLLQDHPGACLYHGGGKEERAWHPKNRMISLRKQGRQKHRDTLFSRMRLLDNSALKTWLPKRLYTGKIMWTFLIKLFSPNLSYSFVLEHRLSLALLAGLVSGLTVVPRLMQDDSGVPRMEPGRDGHQTLNKVLPFLHLQNKQVTVGPTASLKCEEKLSSNSLLLYLSSFQAKIHHCR